MNKLNEQEFKFIKHKTPRLWRFMKGIGFSMEGVGFEPNATDSVGMTALMEAMECACKVNYRYAISLLIKHGWDMNRQDIWNNSPIDFAIRTWNWELTYDLLQYDLNEEILEHALYYSLGSYYARNSNCDRVILRLIEKLGGISVEKYPKAFAFAFGSRAVPFITALMNAGFYFNEKTLELHYKHFHPNFDSKEKVFTRFVTQNNLRPFRNRDDYPIYIENGILYARPELYRKAWPKLSKKIKKEFCRERGPKLKTLNYIAKYTLGS